MTTHLHFRQIAWPMGFVALFGWTSAHADIYTWVDSSGKVNLSNQQPPEGMRVTRVYREDSAVHASAEAARAAAQREELRALTERVAQLEHDLDAANRPAPAPPTPIVYVPIPAPAAYPAAVAEAVVAPTLATYGNCTDSWASCFSPGSFGFYPSGVVVLSASGSHRFRQARRGHGTPPGPTAHSFPHPVGTLPPPVNLFPASHRR